MNETIVVICTIVTALSAVVMAIFAFTNKSQKREVTLGFTPASKVDFDAHVAKSGREIERLAADIKAAETKAANDLQRAIDSGNVSRAELHKRINLLLTAISHLEGKMEK